MPDPFDDLLGEDVDDLLGDIDSLEQKGYYVGLDCTYHGEEEFCPFCGGLNKRLESKDQFILELKTRGWDIDFHKEFLEYLNKVKCCALTKESWREFLQYKANKNKTKI